MTNDTEGATAGTQSPVDNRCAAEVSDPPHHLRTHRCARQAKYEVDGIKVCGQHKRVAERWQSENCLHTMADYWWHYKP